MRIILSYLDINSTSITFAITGVLLTILTAVAARNGIRKRRFQYYLLNILYVLAFLVVILTDNWFIFFMGWEMVTIATTFMLAWSSRRISIQYFIVQFAGSSLLLYVILLAVNAGYNNIGPVDETWLQNMFVLGLGMKSAIFGFHFWLPPIHSRAPFPVSAVLSGWVVKLGFITYLRIIPEGNNLLLLLGMLMIFYGGIKALLTTDYKVLLANSSISQLGYIALGIGSGTIYGYLGSIFHIIAHGLAKTSLFNGSGYWLKEYGTRTIYKFRDSWKRQPVRSISTLIAFSSLMGLPLIAGYNSKHLIKYSLKASPVLIILMHAASLITILYALRFLWWGVLRDIVIKATNNNSGWITRSEVGYHSSGFNEKLSIIPAVFLLLLFGVFPEIITGFVKQKEFNYHLLSGLRDNIIYIVIASGILYKLNWIKVEEKEPPSLDAIFKKIYDFVFSLSVTSRKYDSDVFFETHVYRWVFNGARFIYNTVYVSFQSQLLMIPLLFLMLLLWLSLM